MAPDAPAQGRDLARAVEHGHCDAAGAAAIGRDRYIDLAAIDIRIDTQTRLTCHAGTVSSHTVCQIPVTSV